MQDVEGQLVDLDQDLRPGIEPSLSRTPVVVVCPVPAEFSDLPQRQTLSTSRNRAVVRPTRRAQPAPQVVDLGLRYHALERDQGATHVHILRCRQTTENS